MTGVSRNITKANATGQVLVTHLHALTTHIFVDGAPYLDSDARAAGVPA
jgi:hypothetical protein